ncbi:hypothetical protein Tco_1035322 [Tanacetum coccineum]
MVKSWLVQDQTVLGKDYSNLLIADSLLKTIWFINAPCYGNEALASPKANELTILEQTATGKGTSNPLMAGSLPKTTKPTIQASRDRQKSYADLRRKPLEFLVNDKVVFKVSPWKGVIRFVKRGKLNPRYIGPFKVLAKVGTIDYRLRLLQQLSKVHSTFHVSNLKKCLSDESLVILLDEIHIDDKLHFIEEPVEIIDREVKRLKQSRIPIIKVRWNSI